MVWKPSRDTVKYGVAICNFNGEKVKDGISLRVGDTVQILEECQNWFRGCLIKNKSQKGIFPQNAISIQEAKVENPGFYETVYPQTEPIVQEVTTVLREWGVIWKKLFLEQKTQMYMGLRQIMFELMEFRRQIMSRKLTQDQQREVKNIITRRIDWGNSKLGLDLVPRLDGEIVDSDTLSVIELYKVHVASMESSNSVTKSDSTKSTSTSVPKGGARHLLMNVKNFMVNVGEDSMVFFALYDSKVSEYISERYMIKFTKQGMPRDLDKLEKMTAIFTELTSSDWQREVFLVCHVYREGKLVIDSKKNPLTAFRRPFGVGVVFVADIFRNRIIDEDEQEFTFSVYSCSDSDFHCLEEHIIRKQTTKYNSPGSNVNEICIGLKVVHGDLEKIMEDNPLLKNTNVAVARRLGFPEVIMPGDIRNDFYVTIAHADFEKGGKTAQRNVEVTMSVVTDKGRIVHDSISLGTGENEISEYHSFVLYHNNSPRWNEKVKIQIPLADFHSAHLRFTFSHCTRHESRSKGEKFFGFSFIKLVNEDGTVLKDDMYELFLYKMDSNVSFTDVKTYLRLPSRQADLIAQKNAGCVATGASRSMKESFTIATALCSTKLTQNSELVGLLKWRLKPDDVLHALTSVLNVEAEEIVAFLQDVFDALFNILSDRGNECAMAVLKVLVHVICFVESEKYHRFKSVIDTYINEHFSGALAYKSLISCLKQVLQNKPGNGNSSDLASTMKSLPIVLRIIVKSRFLHNRSSSSTSIEEFQESLMDLFENVNNMMKTKSGFSEAKVNALDQFPSIIDELSTTFSYKELSSIASSFINCVPKVVGSSSSNVRVAKLNCIRKIVCNELFKDQGARATFLPTLIEHLQYYMNTKQELSLCLDILGDVITALQRVEKELVKEDIDLLARSSLFILLNIYLTIDRKGSLTGLTVSCLIGLLRLMEDYHYSNLLDSFEDKRNLKDFLMKFIVAFKGLLSQDVFPSDWFVLRILSNNLILTAIQYLSKAFIDHFLNGNDFDYQLWNNYFQLAVAFLIQPCLQLEGFMENKRDRILDRYGDMRQIMGMEVVDMWENLGCQKRNFIPGLIGPFLEVTLLPEPELRKSTIPIFFDMMQVEFAEEKNFEHVETELIDKLDVFVSNGKGDQEYEKLFRKLILQKLEDCREPSLHDKGVDCVEAISQLLNRLLDYRAVIASDDCGMDEQMSCTVRLLEFYQSLGRIDMYIRYIYKLCDLHISCENYTEAGFTLLLHAHLLNWKEEIVRKELTFPEQPEWERKEQLYLKIIDYFDKGKTWENGLKLCKELAFNYESKLFDYSKLSKILRSQAQFYDNIMRELRPEPEYFRVSFYGQGFPHYLKNHVFVYRGLEYEKLASFTQRLKAQFPNAMVMSTNKPLDESYLQSSGQYIQCCNVQPVEQETPLFKGKKICEKIASYYKVNEVKTFTCSRPFHKGTKNEINEFKTLWLERTTMTTINKFPGILRWSRVTSTTTEELNPLENAVQSIATKNKELEDIIAQFESYPENNINPLSMVLNGVIDANVNGGISKYQTAFLNEEYLFLNPEDEEQVEGLRNQLRDQVDLLASGLALHERLAIASLIPFHDKMTFMFGRMRESIETGVPIEELMSMQGSLTVAAAVTLERNSPRNRSPKLQRNSLGPGLGSPDQEVNKKESHTSMPLIPKGFSLANIGKKLSESFASASTSALEMTLDSNANSKTSSKTLDRRFSSSKSTSALTEENGGPPIPPRRISVPSILQRGSASCSVKSRQAYKPSMSSLGTMKNQTLAGSAPALGGISEDEQVPPKLPMKRKSTLSSRSVVMTIYDEDKEQSLSSQNVFSSSAMEIYNDDKESEQATNGAVKNEQSKAVHNEQMKERPRSMPPEPVEPNAPTPVPRNIPHRTCSVSNNGNSNEERRPIPRPRPRTMILRAESADNLLRSKTMSAENLLKSIPAIDRVSRTGTDIGSVPPPVPLKRAQMYRSQERIGNNGYSTDKSKESKF